MFNIDACVELVKFQRIIRNPTIVLAEDVEITSHRAGGVVAFGNGDAEQPGSFKRRAGETIDGELYTEERLGMSDEFAVQAQSLADVQPVFGMRFARFADQILAFFFDRFWQPHPAHVGIRTVIKDRVFFCRHVFHEIITLLSPTL